MKPLSGLIDLVKVKLFEEVLSLLDILELKYLVLSIHAVDLNLDMVDSPIQPKRVINDNTLRFVSFHSFGKLYFLSSYSTAVRALVFL